MFQVDVAYGWYTLGGVLFPQDSGHIWTTTNFFESLYIRSISTAVVLEVVYMCVVMFFLDIFTPQSLVTTGQYWWGLLQAATL